MTAFSAAIGLIPAAFSTAIGSQVQRPLAIVVVGGNVDWANYVAYRRTGASNLIPRSPD